MSKAFVIGETNYVDFKNRVVENVYYIDLFLVLFYQNYLWSVGPHPRAAME